jgi:hypothetical protein
MAKLWPLTNEGKLEGYAFPCPGCDHNHWIYVVDTGSYRGGSEPTPIWSFNGDVDNPTINPSVLLRLDTEKGPLVCHSFVRNGHIQFLGDCTHHLANQTVGLPEVEE